MTDYHAVLTVLATACGLVGYVLYYRTIFTGATKPHVFTWSVYVVVDAIAFAGAFAKGGGIGTWPVLLGVVANAGIALLAIRWGEKNIRIVDWISFAAALLSVALWVMTSDPLVAVVIVTLINAFAYVPTFRKSYERPSQESISIWVFDVLRFGLSIVALSSINLTTVLFPASAVILNAAMSGMILLRRRAVRRS